MLIFLIQLNIFEDRTNNTNDVFITANDLTAMVVDTKLSQIAMYKDPAARPPLIYQPSVLAAGHAVRVAKCQESSRCRLGTGAGDWYQEKRINWSKERT